MMIMIFSNKLPLSPHKNTNYPHLTLQLNTGIGVMKKQQRKYAHNCKMNIDRGESLRRSAVQNERPHYFRLH